VARRRAEQRALALGLLTLGLAPLACLSDITLPPCDDLMVCDAGGASGLGGAAGAQAGTVADGGVGGEAGLGGEAPSAGTGDRGWGKSEGGNPGGAGAGYLERKCANCVILPPSLPAPCAMRPYSTSLTISGGTPPYQWQVASTTWSIAVDPAFSSRATLSTEAAAASATTLAIDVMDATMAHAHANLSVPIRNTCWFAYTSLETSGAKLQLLDPLAEPPAPMILAHNHGVYDFQFSPDGQYLAYRYGSDETHRTGQHLALVTLSTLDEQPIPVLEDAITAFAWSPDSKLIAVAFSQAQQTYLTGVRIPAPDSDTAPVELPPKPAFVESDLYWIGNTFVAFHAERLADLGNPGQWLPNPYHQRTPFYAKLNDTGFESPQPVVDYGYDPGVYLQPTGSGFFMITDSDPFTYFNALSPTVAAPTPLSFTRLISPSGQYSASIEDGQLQIFSAADGELSPAVAVSDDGEKCPMLLAWAKDRERIACIADVPNDPPGGIHGEVRIFDLNAREHRLTMSTLRGFCTDDTDSAVSAGSCAALQNEYSYSEARASGHARGFSPSGRWLAFTAASTDGVDNYLYWADLNEVPFSLKRKSYFFTTQTVSDSPTELAFSPDERFLLLRRGNQLAQQDLTAGPESGPTRDAEPLTSSLESSDECMDDFASAPDRWCGNTDRSALFRWAPDSTAAAFRTPDHVTVVDVTQFPVRYFYPLPAPACGQQCAGQFAFQPTIKP